MVKEFNEFRVSNDAFDNPEELRRRLDEEGYIFFRKLQDPDKLLSLRRDMLEVLRGAGWLVDGTELMDGIADISEQCTEGDPEYTEVYHTMYKLESFHLSGHWPEVMAMMEKVINGPVLPHPMKIARLWFPKYTDHTTPIHQDFVHFQGVFDTYTCWSPVGDCPTELGGLAVLPGSHKINKVHDHHFSLGTGALSISEKDIEGGWVTTDYEIGDSLIFHSLTVHQALPNLTEDRLRVSLDNRYQSAEFAIAGHMLEPHLGGEEAIKWDEVYRDWSSTELQYYWKGLELEALARIEKWGAQAFEEALELARRGDKHATYHLRRMLKWETESEPAKRAIEVLERANQLIRNS